MLNHDVLLYAENDSSYADLLKSALNRGASKPRIVHVPDGEEAIAYFKGERKYADRQSHPLPGVALLDLKMPRINGFEVLQWIREKSPFRYLPVVVFTSSDEIRDINRAYELGANSFLIKPPRIEDLRELLKTLENFWFKFNVAIRRT